MGGKMVPLQKYIRCSARPLASLRLHIKTFKIKLHGLKNRRAILLFGSTAVHLLLVIRHFLCLLRKAHSQEGQKITHYYFLILWNCIRAFSSSGPSGHMRFTYLVSMILTQEPHVAEINFRNFLASFFTQIA